MIFTVVVHCMYNKTNWLPVCLQQLSVSKQGCKQVMEIVRSSFKIHQFLLGQIE